MKLLKKIFSISLCIIICFSFTTTVSAETKTPKITVSNVTAEAGETVSIVVDISDNPGIMAMAFCITYDSEVLTFKNYSKGYLTSYTVKDHSDKGHIAFVNVENKDIATNGTIISLLFEVKKDAKPGKHVIALANSNRDKHGTKLHNSFSTSKQEFIVPIVASGSVTVPETCENSGHKWGEWNIITEANCTETGLQNHVCMRCNLEEEAIIPVTHDFEAEWTIDKVATPEEDGIMSRHCTKCDEVTDQFTFKYEEITEDDEESEDTSCDDSGDDSSIDTPSNDTSNDNVSDNSSDTSSDNTSSDNTSSNPIKPQKPNVDNTLGEKVPLEEVEKFEDYQQNVKPGPEPDDTSSEDVTSNNSSNQDNSSVTIGTTDNNKPDNKDDETSFFDSTAGVVTVVLCSILLVGTLVLSIIVIIKKKKQ